MGAETSQFYAAAGLTWHVMEHGEGAPVLLLHGFPEHHRSWRHNVEALVAAGRRVYVPDLKGYGLTDKPEPGSVLGDYRVSRLSEELGDLIAALGHERIDVIGHDWGGILLSAMMVTRPQRLRRTVLVNAPYRRFAPWAPRHVYLFNLPSVPERRFWRDPEGFVGGIIRRWAWRHDAFGADDIRDYVRSFQRGGSISCAFAYYRGLRRDLGFIGKAVLMGNGVAPPPTLVVFGARDPIMPPLVARMAQRDLGRARLELIDDAGHFPHAESPERFNRAVTQFLSGD